jgi:hypothetical protein
MITSRFKPAVQSVPANSPDVATRMRRWTFLMIGGTLLLATCFVGVQIYLMKASAKPHEEPTDRNGQPPWASQTAPGQARSLLFKAQEAAPKTDAMDAMFDVVSGLTRAHLSQTNLNIGLLADAAENEKPSYSVAELSGLLEDINNFIDEVEKQFIQLPPSAFKTEEDRKDMELARTITTLLRVQTKELKAYWVEGTKEHVDRFKKARQDAEAGIRKMAHAPE